MSDSQLQRRIINGIIDREGGYVNDPNDSGGETNWGITVAVASDYGYEGEMRDLPRELAYAIYAERYWHALHLDDIERLSPALANELADTGVNMGIERAGIFLQRALNVLNDRGNLYPDITVDGKVGRRTISALLAFLHIRKQDGHTVLLRALNALQGAFYIDLAERRVKDERYVFGWLLHRVII
jgi:lysozyme family protein